MQFRSIVVKHALIPSLFIQSQLIILGLLMYNIDGTVLLRFIQFLKPPEISYREVFFF